MTDSKFKIGDEVILKNDNDIIKGKVSGLITCYPSILVQISDFYHYDYLREKYNILLNAIVIETENRIYILHDIHVQAASDRRGQYFIKKAELIKNNQTVLSESLAALEKEYSVGYVK